MLISTIFVEIILLFYVKKYYYYKFVHLVLNMLDNNMDMIVDNNSAVFSHYEYKINKSFLNSLIKVP
jgi:hypothetical protein